MKDLFVLFSQEWDVELLEELFNGEDVANIIIMLTGIDGEVDTRIWHHDRKGIYSVKTGYHFFVDKLLPCEKNIRALSWTKWWKFNLPPKVKFFLWKLCIGFLPSREKLSLKGVDVQNSCVICGDFGDHYSHIF